MSDSEAELNIKLEDLREDIGEHMEDSLIKDCFNKIKEYNFREAADMLIYCIGYLESIEDYKYLVEILKSIYELL